jgi:hypothetical protein
VDESIQKAVAIFMRVFPSGGIPGSGLGVKRKAEHEYSTRTATVKGREHTERLKLEEPLEWLQDKLRSNYRTAVSKAKERLMKSADWRATGANQA